MESGNIIITGMIIIGNGVSSDIWVRFWMSEYHSPTTRPISYLFTPPLSWPLRIIVHISSSDLSCSLPTMISAFCTFAISAHLITVNAQHPIIKCETFSFSASRMVSLGQEYWFYSIFFQYVGSSQDLGIDSSPGMYLTKVVNTGWGTLAVQVSKDYYFRDVYEVASLWSFSFQSSYIYVLT